MREAMQTDTDEDYCDLAVRIADHLDFGTLKAKETDFVEKMARDWEFSVSSKQRAWLDAIAEKLGILPLHLEREDEEADEDWD
jgi:hypothetical protein